jgi:clathrin heavy chain
MKSSELVLAPEAQGDFPILMQCSERFGILFIITKMGYLFIYEIMNAVLLFRQRITDSLIFVSTKNPTSDGVICINKAG